MAAVALELARREGGGGAGRTHFQHHGIQEKGRSEVFLDYPHLRVGQVTEDSRLPPGIALAEQRLDETEVGEGTMAHAV